MKNSRIKKDKKDKKKKKVKKKTKQQQQQLENNIIKDIKKYFQTEKNNLDIRNHFGQQEESYYKTVRVGNFWSNSYIEYESNDDRNKMLSIEE